MHEMHEMIGKIVEVTADGIMYRGQLIEIGEKEVHLKAETGWLVLNAERITQIVLAE